MAEPVCRPSARWPLRRAAGRRASHDSDAAIEAVIVRTLETSPAGETHWSTRTMAKAAGISHSTIGRIWRTFHLPPHRTESFTLSPDPQLVAKIRDVVGLRVTYPRNHRSRGPVDGHKSQAASAHPSRCGTPGFGVRTA